MPINATGSILVCGSICGTATPEEMSDINASWTDDVSITFNGVQLVKEFYSITTIAVLCYYYA